MSDQLMDWLQRNNPDMSRVLHDERYFNGAAIERLQAENERLVKSSKKAWAFVAAYRNYRISVESMASIDYGHGACIARSSLLDAGRFLDCSLKEAGDEYGD